MLSYLVIPLGPLTYCGLYTFSALPQLVGAFAVWLLGKGLIDLGQSLTPLPYPRDDGRLIQTGVYGIVRHCLYSGVILLAIAGSIYWLSVPHLLASLILFMFFDAKASQEERWLCDRYPEYPVYRQKVKKLLPFIY